jgi:hypothetical protein
LLVRSLKNLLLIRKDTALKKVDFENIWNLCKFKIVQTKNMFKFVICSIFKMCSNMKSVQIKICSIWKIQNLLKFKIVQTTNLFKFENCWNLKSGQYLKICSDSKSVQIQKSFRFEISLNWNCSEFDLLWLCAVFVVWNARRRSWLKEILGRPRKERGCWRNRETGTRPFLPPRPLRPFWESPRCDRTNPAPFSAATPAGDG